MSTVIKYVQKQHYQVVKNGNVVASITKESPAAHGNWRKDWHWALKHISGRIDRHATFSEARSDALKI